MRPDPDRLERAVEMVRTKVKERVAHEIESQLTAAQKNQLDELLTVPTGETKSPLQRFKETPARASSNELLEVLEKIEALRALGLDALDLGAGRIHPNRVKLLARRAKQRTNWVTAQLCPQQRYLMLVCFLDQALHNYVDLAVAMYVETIKSIFQRAETKRDKELVERGKSLNDKVMQLPRSIGSIRQGEIPLSRFLTDPTKSIEIESSIASRFRNERSITIYHIVGNHTCRIHAQAFTESVVVHLSLNIQRQTVVHLDLCEILYRTTDANCTIVNSSIQLVSIWVS